MILVTFTHRDKPNYLELLITYALLNFSSHTYVCIAVFTLDAGLLARSQYSEGPATGHLNTGFLGFPVSISKC